MEIKGSDLAPGGDARTWQGSDFVKNQMPAQLDGVSVTVNGKPAYVYYISPTQLNILTPPDALSGTVQAQALSPSFFEFSGGSYVAATHLNEAILGQPLFIPDHPRPHCSPDWSHRANFSSTSWFHQTRRMEIRRSQRPMAA